MRIAVLQDDFPPHHQGGSGLVAYRLAKESARRGHALLVITTVREARHAGREFLDGFEVVRLQSDYRLRFRAYASLYNPRIVRRVARLMREFKPDVVHAHNVHTYLSYASLRAAKRYARAVVMTAHDTMAIAHGKLPDGGATREDARRQLADFRWRYNPLRVPLIKLLLGRYVDCVVAVSESLKRALEDNGLRDVRVIRNGIDAEEWREPSCVSEWKRSRGIGERAVLFAGRPSAAKGAYVIVEAFAEAARQAPGAQLMIAGKKEGVGEKMTARAERLDIGERLVFTGWIDGEDLRRAYYAVALVAVPSIYLDPFPTVNLEAFACGKPVVATRFGGSPELVEDGVSGFIVDPRDTHALAAKIETLLSDGDMRRRFGEAGRARVIADFTLAEQAERYERLFRQFA